MIFLVSDCRFDVSPVNYPDLDMIKLGRVDWCRETGLSSVC